MLYLVHSLRPSQRSIEMFYILTIYLSIDITLFTFSMKMLRYVRVSKSSVNIR